MFKIQNETSISIYLIIIIFLMRFGFTETTHIWVHHLKSFNREKSKQGKKGPTSGRVVLHSKLVDGKSRLQVPVALVNLGGFCGFLRSWNKFGLGSFNKIPQKVLSPQAQVPHADKWPYSHNPAQLKMRSFAFYQKKWVKIILSWVTFILLFKSVAHKKVPLQN